jgi:hypothetical protein
LSVRQNREVAMKHDEIATKKIIELAALANDGDAATESR